MKITKVNIPKAFNNDGIEDINMDRLGDIVLIAGKNGSGKTRLLNKIQMAIGSKPSSTLVKARKQLIEESTKQLKNEEAALYNLKTALKTIPDNQNKIYVDAITRSEENLNTFNNNIRVANETLNWSFITTDKEYESYPIIPFIPKIKDLTDPNTLTKQTLLQYSNNVDIIGINNLPVGVLAKIQVIQEKWFNATHPNSTLSEREKQKCSTDYQSLKNILKTFLNTDLDRNSNGDATLFGFPLGGANFSDGQKILIQLSIAIFSQEPNLQNLILFLDEPENHLHPSAIIETIDLLVKNLKNGQIWISTHSVPLLAHFDPSNIWYVEDNKISYAGNIPEKVLSSLLGDENEIGRLQDLISLPSTYALNQYAYECLIQPTAVSTNSNDPQTKQINEQLASIVKSEKLKILDFGAGKGRLLSNIFENFNQDVDAILEKIEYIAYDEYDSDKEVCKKVIATVYEKSENYYFNDFTSLLTKHDKESFDVVIMCNVLHEIDPKDWLNLFAKEGTITNLLKEHGVVLIVEDTLMPTGEKAYSKGFIVLDTPQIKELFNLNSSDIEKGFVISDARNDGRLKAHTIPKSFISNISKDTRIKALKSLQDTAKQKITKIRAAAKTYKNGKIHAFWVQQFANTSLALSELTSE